VGNSRAAFAVATALAGPLLAWAQGVTGGGIHYTGQTSIGKTTCFLLAASVWGKGTEKDPDSYMQKWRATSNGLEYQGEQHNDCTLILDELGQMDAGDAGNAAYMLADGMGKTRGKGAGGLRPKPTWRLLFLSSGELTLAQHMETVGKKMKGGQEVRLIPIPTEVKEGSALETFHEFASGHELSSFVQHNAARCYGTVGRAWLEYLVAHTDGLGAALRERMDAIEAQIVPAGASGQVKRGGRRFALIAAAGEMATAAGLTAWPAGEATRATHMCFDAWLKLRGGPGSSEKTNMLRQVRAFLETHGDGRFAMWHRGADDHAAKTLHRAGVRRMLNEDGEPIKTNSQHGAEFGDNMPASVGENVSYEYFVLAETFKTEVCKGFDVQAVCAVLLEHGSLIVKEPGRYSIKTKLPGIGPARCYLIPPAIFDLDV
jgi:putative DNA primase/helicase